MDFDKPKVYGDTSITDGLVFLVIDLASGILSMDGSPMVSDDGMS